MDLKKIKANPMFKPVLEEMHFSQQKKMDVKRIMKLCLESENKTK